jgi:hypothetical protein
VVVAAICGGALVLGRLRGGELLSSSDRGLGGFEGSVDETLVSIEGFAMSKARCSGMVVLQGLAVAIQLLGTIVYTSRDGRC